MPCLLPAFSGEQICCRVGTVRPRGAVGKAILAARGSVSRAHLESIGTVPLLPSCFCLQQKECVSRAPRETTDCYRHYGSCRTADISTDGNSYVPAKPQLDTWTSHHWDNGRWVSSRAYFHFRSGR